MNTNTSAKIQTNEKSKAKVAGSGKKSRPFLRLNTRGKVIILFAVMIILGVIISNLANWFGSYDGLGIPQTVPENSYDRELFVYDEKGRLHYEDENLTAKCVLDVSAYQKDIDWNQVASDGVDMVMIRLGYRGYKSGKLALDKYYEQNAEGARKAGLDAGVYFFSQAVSVEEAEEEARFVLRHIRGKKIKGPIAFDMEQIKGAERINNLTVGEKTAIADAFCRFIEKNGHDAMVYGNPTWLTNDVDLSLLTDHEIWLAHYTGVTDCKFAYAMWQYTDSAKVAGIEGGADLSILLLEK